MLREFGTPYNSNATFTKFQRTMEREGKVCTTYTDGIKFKAFFRRKDDSENEKEVIVLYYGLDAPVRPGTLICYRYGVFLALNRETVENDVYFKSTLVKCNGIFNDNSGYGAMNIPFYTDNMQSSISVSNNVITTLNGNIECITEENSISKTIAIGHTFNEFGRTFKIGNFFIMDGIIHIIGEVHANIEPTNNYIVVIDGMRDSKYSIGDTMQLSATLYINGAVTTGATIEWSSNNTSVATVSDTGLVSFVEEGSVTISAKWIEKGVTGSVGGIVGGQTAVYHATVTGNTSLKTDSARTCTATLYDSSDNVITEGIEWEWSFTTDADDGVVMMSTSGNSCILSYDDEDYVTCTIILTAMSKNTGHAASIDIKMAGVF